MINTRSSIFIFFVLLLLMQSICYAEGVENTFIKSTFIKDTLVEGNFYESDNRRYRGFHWFEEKSLENEQRQKQIQDQKANISPDEAREKLEKFKQEMDDKRAIMMAAPSAKSVKDYMDMEAEMWKRAFALENAYREAKFRYPYLFDKSKEPTNVHAVKFKRGLEIQAREEKVKAFAQDFDLVLFSKEDCVYCHEFAPVLKVFSEKYGFITEEISMEGSMSGLFKGRAMPRNSLSQLGKSLGIEVTPTIVAVSKDGKQAFELIRGYVTISELEEYVDLAGAYLETLKSKKPTSKNKNKISN